MSPDVSYLRKRPDGQRDSDENSPSEIMRQSSRMNALEVDLREVIRRLWRHRSVIFGIVVLGTVIAGVVLAQLTPLYTATAQVMINPRHNQVVNLEAVMSGLPPDQETIQSEIQVIRSRGLSERVINKVNLFRKREFNSRLREPSVLATILSPRAWLPESLGEALFGQATALSEEEQASLERSSVISVYLGSLSVSRVDRSRVIEISFVSEESGLAQTVVNAVADLYIVEQLEAKYEATKKATEWLNDRLGELRKQVDAAERAVEVYRAQSGLTEAKGLTLTSQQISELSTQLVLARTKRTEAEARLGQVRGLLSQNEGTSSVAEVLASPLIQSLREQESAVLRKAAELSQEYGDKHPRMINTRAEIENIRNKIALEVRRIVQGLQNEVTVARSREKSLEEGIRRLERQVGDLNRAEIQLRALEREASANRALYENFLSRFKELSEQDEIQTADARVVSYADLPASPSFPKKLMILMIAFVGSGVAGVGVAGVLERLDNGFRSMEQVEQQTGIPAISLIPALPKSARKRQDYVLERPHSAYAESVRSLYASLHLSNVDSPPKVILMTSSVPEEGKSLTGISLARSIARAGKKVVLVDCDLRRPQIHTMLGMEYKPGVVEVLAGEEALDAVLRRDEASGAFVLTAGTRPTNPVDLLSSQQMHKLIYTLRESADMVIIDSAPIAAVSDARILASMVDKTVFVVRWATTRREVVAMALRQLLDARAEFAGVVLSRVDVKKHSRYGYGDSGYYYGRSAKYYTE